MSWLSWIVVGFIAGALAKASPGSRNGLHRDDPDRDRRRHPRRHHLLGRRRRRHQRVQPLRCSSRSSAPPRCSSSVSAHGRRPPRSLTGDGAGRPRSDFGGREAHVDLGADPTLVARPASSRSNTTHSPGAYADRAVERRRDRRLLAIGVAHDHALVGLQGRRTGSPPARRAPSTAFALPAFRQEVHTWIRLGAVHDGADPLDVGVPSPLRAPVRVADAHAELRLLAADVAHGCHRNHLGTGSGTAKDGNGIQKPPNVGGSNIRS